MKKNKVGIIGAGVAGLSAAIYLKRSGIDCFIIEKYIPGGQIIDNGNIENYPGFDSISGTDLTLKILDQVKEQAIPLLYDEVVDIEFNDTSKKIITKKSTFDVSYIIIATGRYPRILGVKGEELYRNKGISYCAVCDGSLYKNKEVLVVGAGDSATFAAVYLSKIASSVKVLYRNNFRSKKYLQERLKTNNNIELIKGEVLEFSKEKNRILVKTNNGLILTDGVFIYVGQEPNTLFLQNLHVLDDDGYVLVNDNYETKIDGIYAVGDCLKKEFYQIVIAMSEGVQAALNISRRV